MLNIMTVDQQNFFKKYKGTKNKHSMLVLKKWLSQSEVDTVTYIDRDTCEESWAGRLRGVRVTSTFSTINEAVDMATKFKNELIKETKDIELDSDKLNIDGKSYKQAQKYGGGDAPIHIENCIHLGMDIINSIDSSDALKEFIDFLSEDSTATAYGKLQDLKAAIINSGTDDDDDDDDDDEAIYDLILDLGFFGIVLYVRTPIKKFGNGSMYSFSWGSCYCQWVYGETFDEALEVGKQWADSMTLKDKEKVSLCKNLPI